MSKHWARIVPLHGALCWVGLLFLVGLGGCEVSGKNEVARRLIRPVSVTVEGRVVDATTGAALEGIEVGLQQRALQASAAGGATADASPAAKTRSDAGVVSASDDRELVPGISVKTDEEGGFSLQATLDIESFDYNLRAFDAAGGYVVYDSFRVYAGSDATINAGVLRLTPSTGEQRATVRGTVVIAAGGSAEIVPMAGAEIVLIDPSDDTRYVATSGEDGKYEVGDVPFRDYALEIKSPLDPEDARVLLLPVYRRTLRLATERQATDPTSGITVVTLQTTHMPATAVRGTDGTVSPTGLTIVLSWEAEDEACKSTGELHAELSLPGSDCDSNHLGGAQIELPRATSLNPSGFGVATCMWPSNLGGRTTPVLGVDESSDPEAAIDRVALNATRRVHTLEDPFDIAKFDPFFANLPNRPDASCTDVSNIIAKGVPFPKSGSGECATAFFGRVAEAGKGPEILRVTRNRGTTDWPDKLGYYYRLPTENGADNALRYPMGFGALRVSATGECSLDQLRAVVEVYDDDTLLSRFERTAASASETDASVWTPLVLEHGARLASPRAAKDMYFRVLPLDSAAPTASAVSYFYQDVATQRATCDGEEGDCERPLPLTSAAGAIALGDSDLAILGRSREVVEGSQQVLEVPGVYRQRSPGVWRFYATPPSASPSANASLVRDGNVLVVSEGRNIVFEQASGQFGQCSSCSDVVVGMVAAPGPGLLVATKNRLQWFDPQLIGNNDCSGAEPAACAPLRNGVPKPLDPLDGKAEISWVGRSERSQKPLVAVQGMIWEIGSVSKEGGAQDWRPYVVTVGVRPLSLIEVGADSWIGTDLGLHLAKTDPAPADGTPESTLLRACPVDGADILDARPSVFDQRVQAVARYGSRIVFGTSAGLGITDTETIPALEPGGKPTEQACVRWFPTRGDASGARALPPFPANLNVKGLLVVGGELVVLTEEQGLFRLRGGL